MADTSNKHEPDKPKTASRQTDLAEGEPETVDESLRIHENKQDDQSGKKPKP